MYLNLFYFILKKTKSSEHGNSDSLCGRNLSGNFWHGSESEHCSMISTTDVHPLDVIFNFPLATVQVQI